MPNLKRSFSAKPLIAGFAVLMAAPAMAADDSELVVSQPSGDLRVMEVKVGDLDLTSAYDRDTLEIRINRAADYVCDVNDGSKLDRLPDARECLDRARAGAMAQLSSAADVSPEMRSAGG